MREGIWYISTKSVVHKGVPHTSKRIGKVNEYKANLVVAVVHVFEGSPTHQGDRPYENGYRSNNSGEGKVVGDLRPD
jgi:hypothetical protein